MTPARKKTAKKAAKKSSVKTRVSRKVTEPPYTVVETANTGAITGAVSPVVSPLIPQPHGGALRPGRPANPAAGPGRPKDEVRAAFLGVSAKGAQFLNELMDGVVKVDFVGVCPHCEQTSEPPVPATLIKSLLGSLNGSLEARLRATDMSARYGLSAKELVIASPQAKAFFDCVHAAIVELSGEDMAAQVQTRAVALMDEARS